MQRLLNVENEPVDPPFNMLKSDKFMLEFTNMTLTLTDIKGKVTAIRKIKDEDGNVIGICPVISQEGCECCA